MPRWLYGGAITVYLAGTLGLGLSSQMSENGLQFLDAMFFGASWPLMVLRQLNIL